MNKPSTHSNDSQPQTSTSPTDKSEQKTDSLLDELESIKDLLEESSLDETELNDIDLTEVDLDSDLNIDIPILDDVVPASQQAQQAASDLLDLKAIFDDDDEDASAPAPEPGQQSADKAHDETQLNFDGLDVDIDIPSFKLSLQEDPANGATTEAARVDIPTLAEPAEQNDLEAPGEPEAQQDTLTQTLSNLDDIPILEPVTPPATTDLTPAPQTTPIEPPTEPPTTPASSGTAVIVDIDLLIQELVDEMVPVMEDRLRQRLSSYPADIIQQLAKKYLKE